MALNVPGVVVMVFFYLIILGTGIWASFKSKKETKSSADRLEMTLLGNRGISLVVGMFTMTATWIGGGFFNNLAEAIYNPSQGMADMTLLVSAYFTAFMLCQWLF